MSSSSTQAAAQKIAETTKSLESIILNGAILIGRGELNDLSSKVLMDMLEVNVGGTHNALRAFLPLLLASKSSSRNIAIISSAGGSVSQSKGVAEYLAKLNVLDYSPVAGYGISK